MTRQVGSGTPRFEEPRQHSNRAVYYCTECGDRFPHVEEARLCARIDRLERRHPIDELLEKKE